MAMAERERTAGDKLSDHLSDRIFGWLIDELEYGSWTDFRPVLLEDHDPEVYPLVVDIGDERYLVEVDVTVHQIERGGPSDWSQPE
jgi:hypothetical protein